MIRVRQIKVLVENDSLNHLYEKVARKLKISTHDILSCSINKQSLDARLKDEIYYVYEVDVLVKNEEAILKKNKSNDILRTPDETYTYSKCGNIKLKNRPVIVGSGPAGLFAAYLLADAGLSPIIIERGEKIDKRIISVSNFWKTGKLNVNSNVQFGEGGAGTFSDGKLNTLVKDLEHRGKKVFDTFIECGAPEDIRYSYKPHIGTNLLVDVIQNLRDKILEKGGTFLYETCLTDLFIEDDKLVGIEVNYNEKIDCEVLILAIGHSARDTFYMLYKYLKMEAKPFALGIRVQHLQSMINESQYGEKYKDILGAASYKLTYKASNNRGVYSFCMCPGGYVVNASSEPNRLAINGMSNHERDSKNANSAIVVTVLPTDFGNDPLSGIEYQRNLEEKAYFYGQGKIPVQLLKDFMKNQLSSSFGKVKPIMKGEYTFSNLSDILPNDIIFSLKEAFPYFGQKIKYFDDEDTILAAIESRTSSPVRIIRNEMEESNIEGIYPAGEGAGYAGGITSAAMDGLKVAEAILKKYK